MKKALLLFTIISVTLDVAVGQSQIKIMASDRAGYDYFGWNVAIDSNFAIVGAHGDEVYYSPSWKYDAGSAYILKRSGNSWSQESKISASDPEGSANFGRSVAISDTFVVVGAYADDHYSYSSSDWRYDAGSAYIFKRDPYYYNWYQQTKLTPSDTTAYDYFGNSVAISGDYVIIAAYQDDDKGTNSGSAYIFKRTGTSWSQEAKLTASDGASNDYFGYSVAISGDYAVIGAYGDDDNGTSSGSVYIFNRTGAAWSQEAKLSPSDGASYDYFGYSVAISGDYAVIGAYGDDDNGGASGSAYIFKRTGAAWSQEAKLTAGDGTSSDFFGYSVNINGEYAIIGAYADDDKGSASGSVYIFNRSGTSWSQQNKFTADDGVASDNFGYSVANSGESLIIGAPYADSSGYYSIGAAYIYNSLPPAAPSGLAVTAGSEQVILKWNKNTESDFKWYYIYGGTSSNPTTRVDSTTTTGGVNDTTKTITGLTNGTTYYYRITAVDTSGNESGYSNEVSAVPSLFSDISAGLTGVRYSSVAWGDYDNDGDLDILLTGYTGSSYISKVYKNTNGSFSDISASLTGVIYSSVAWGDYDNDGDLDILLTGYTGSGYISKVYKNTNGSFSDISANLTGVRYGSVAWGDYDNDGDLDILLTGYNDYSSPYYYSKVYKNTNGSFSDISAGLTGVRYSSVAWGDYDNDGDLDILLTGYTGSGYISKVYKNTNGSFSDISANLTGVYHSSVDWGDYDSDGDLDILLSGYTGSAYTSRVYRNANGSFTNIGAALTGVRRGSVRWGDYDNDGDLDVLLTGYNGSYLSKVYQNTSGTFSDIGAGLTIAGVRYSSAVWGDYDGDGDLDILLTGYTGSNYLSKIYKNATGTSNSAPAAPTVLIKTVSGDSATFSWKRATDDSTAQKALTYNLRVGTTSTGVEIVSPMADTSSGLRRIPALGNVNHDTTWTIKNLGDGTYYWGVQAIDNSFAGSAFATGASFTLDAAPAVPTNLAVTVGNQQVTLTWNANSESDFKWYYIYGGTSSNPTTKVDSTTTTGGVNDTTATITGLTNGTTYYYRITAVDDSGNESGYSSEVSAIPGDVTAPATPTGLVASAGNAQVTLTWSANSESDFNRYRIYGGTSSSPTTKVDSTTISGGVNDTTVTDTSLTNGTTYYYRITAVDNAGNESSYSSEVNATPALFPYISAGLTGVYYSSVAWGDYDNDGDLDILLTGYDGSSYISKVYKNTDGSFSDISAGLTGVYYSSVAWGDYDNDGDLDILLTGYEGTTYPYTISKVYKNTNGSFSDISAGLPGVYRGSVAWGDYDNDGDLDILLTGYNDYASPYYHSKVYKNTNGSFSDISAGLTGVRYSSVAWGDYDSDGDLDILLTGYNGSNYISKVYQNTDGSFSDISAGLMGVYRSSVTWGDYDNDGDLDILLTGYSSSYDGTASGSYYTTKVYKNTNGSFSDVSAGLIGVNQGSVAWGDYDNDGDLDILLSGYNGYYSPYYYSKVYKNTNGSFSDISAGLTEARYSSVAWGDYDNDGDLDILLTGYDGSNYISKCYRNTSGTANAAPAAPTGLTSSVSGTSVTLNWNKSSDDSTAQNALTYNLRVGTASGGVQTISPMSDLSSGRRRIPALGNVNHDTTWTIKNLGDGTYYWGVQAIDNGWAGSPFPTGEVSFVINAAPPAVPTGLIATADSAKVTLRWRKNSESDLHKYRIYRDDNTTVQTLLDSVVTTSPPDSFYVDSTGLTNGLTYYYHVTAVDSGGSESGSSNKINTIPNTARDQIVELLVDSTESATYYQDAGYPLNAYYHDVKHQSLYLADDLSKVGIPDSVWISAIAIKPSEGPGDTLNDFRIATAFTSNTTLSTFDSTNVRNGPTAREPSEFTPDQWKRFPIQAINWNGTDNLVVEFSHDNDEYNDNGGVYLRQAGSDRARRGWSDSGSGNYPFSSPMGSEASDDKVVALRIIYGTLEPPTNLVATASDRKVDLSWTKSSASDISNHVIYRGAQATALAKLDTVSATDSTFTDTTVTNGLVYYYGVRAKKGSDYSGFTNIVSATPLYPGPVWWVATDGTGDGSESTPFGEISSAMTKASAGDTVKIKPGTYSGSSNRGLYPGGKSLVIMSTHGADTTILDAGGFDRHFSFDSGVDTTFQVIGLTFKNGVAPDNFGGSIHINNASIRFKDCVFRDNRAVQQGGAIYIGGENPAPRFTGCTIVSNKVTGTDQYGGYNAHGGGIYIISGAPEFIDCKIDSNVVETAQDSYNDGFGGGVFIDGFNNLEPAQPVRFTRCYIRWNEVRPSYYAQGGGLDIGARAVLVNCVIAGNKAEGGNFDPNWSSGRGGGLRIDVQQHYVSQTATYETGDVKIVNCTIAGNTATRKTSSGESQGGGIHLMFDKKVTIFNTIIWGNVTEIKQSIFDDNSTVIAGYNDIEHGNTYPWFNTTNSKVIPPAFTKPDSGIYSLSDASPLIGAGATTWEDLTAPTDDILGNIRPNPAGSNPDLGAYENAFGVTPYPARVTGLTAAPGDQQVTLNWNANTESDLEKYFVYRSTTAGFISDTSNKVTEISAPTTTYTDLNLTNGTTYFYRVAAVDSTGYEGLASEEVSAKPDYMGPVWWVATDGNDANNGSNNAPFANLKTAYDKAVADQDTIKVKAGVYLSVSGANAEWIDVTKNVVIIAVDGPENTTLDANYDGRHFYIQSPVDNNFILKGFTLRNGWDNSGGGGSIFINNASPRLVNCRFVDNWDADNGGAITVFNGSPTFIGCVFDSNQVDSEFQGNGGAVDIQPDYGQLTAQDSVRFFRCTFRANGVSTVQSAFGGAVHVTYQTRFVNCLFADNWVQGGINATAWESSNGGAVMITTLHWDGFQDVSLGRAEFVNCTIVSNQAIHPNSQGTGSGGALFIDSGSQVVMFNTLVFGNAATEEASHAIWDGGSILNSDYNYLQQGADQKWYFPSHTYRDFPPGFTDLDNQDYSLADHSPLLDKGTSEPFAGITPPVRDIRRYPRLGTNDIGAYEAGVPRIFITLPQEKQKVDYSSENVITIEARNPYGDLVPDNTPVLWKIVPDRGFITIVSDSTDNVTKDGKASLLFTITSSTDAQTFEFRVLADVDGVINTSGVYYIDSEFDGTIPAPRSIAIEPVSWNAENNFKVSWVNPEWTKTFVGAFISIDEAKEEYYGGDGLVEVDSLQIPKQGIVDIEVYLVDDFGRSNADSAVIVQAKWDQTPPQGFNLTDPPPDSWSSPTPHFSWDPSDDSHSSIEGYDVIIDANPVTRVAGTQNFYDLPESAALPDGNHEWWVNAVDSAGNAAESYERRWLWIDTTPPNVTHGPVSQVDQGSSINIGWNADDAGSGVGRASLYYRRSGDPQWKSQDLFNNNNISGSDVTDRGVDYYLEVEDAVGNVAKIPANNYYYSVRVQIPSFNSDARQGWSGGIPSGKSVDNYQFFSIPYDVGNAKGVIDAAFGEYDKTLWRFFGYQGDWVEYPNLSNVRTGDAYFVINGNDDPALRFQFNFSQGVTNPTDNPWEVNLSAGQWVFIGNPFGFNVSLNDVYTNPDDPEGSLIAGDNNFRTWQSGQWPTSGELKPWMGYIYKSAAGGTLYIDPRGIGGSSKPLAGEPPLEEGEWLVDITASSGRLRDEQNQLGVRYMAQDHYDRMDAFQPPLPPGAIALMIDNRQWEENGDIYTRDIRAVNEEGHFWDLEVVAPPQGNSVYLDFERIAEIPAGFDVFIVDKTIGQAQNLRWDPSYHYVKTSGNQKLRFLAGTREFLKKNNAGIQLYPEAYSLSQNFPNPFNPQTTIVLALEDNATVDLVIYNLLGQEVARLARNEARPAGYYQFIWRGTDRQGRRVASGVYFYSARVHSLSGKVLLSKTRKMLLVK